MIKKENWVFQNEATTVNDGSSNTFVVNDNETLTLELYGDATTFSISVQGIVDANSTQWADLAVINLGDFSTLQAIAANGIYSVDPTGLYKIRCNLTVISGGSITAFGRFTA